MKNTFFNESFFGYQKKITFIFFFMAKLTRFLDKKRFCCDKENQILYVNRIENHA